jgi:hypothetical protein
MMGRSHLVVNGAFTAVTLTWVHALRDPAGIAALTADGWLRDISSRLMVVVGQGAPTWTDGHPVSATAERIWAWLFPLADTNTAGGQVASVAYCVIAVLLLLLGTVLPDADSKSSLLAGQLPFAVPGPHRGMMHTDWALIVLFAAAFAPPTRFVFWLWLGAWLHCEMDGLSTAGRVRFYPLTRHRHFVLSGEVCVGRQGRHVSLYRAGSTSEMMLLGGLLAASVLAIVVALRL